MQFPDSADDRLNFIGQVYDDVVLKNPDLLGIKTLAGLEKNLTAAFSDLELSLLSSALYLDARQRVRTD